MVDNFTSYIPDKMKDYVIFDIGSRDCAQSIEFYNKFPNAKIYAFECNPNTIDICRKNIENYKDRITLIEGAVCDYDGEITFYPINQKETITTWVDGNPGASSLFKSNGTYTMEHYVQDEIKTNCHRLDSIMKINNILKVDIIWMDLQGAELLALKSLGEYFKSVKYINTEVSYKEMYSGQVMFNELNNFIISNDFSIKNHLSMYEWQWQEDVIYEKIEKAVEEKHAEEDKEAEKEIFDIVIPVGPNDIDTIRMQVGYTLKNIIGYRNVYLIYIDNSLQIEGCITITEDIFPFSNQTVAEYHGKMDRNGWYLQQLLKLYAGLIIPNILDKYLVIDADTFFLKPTLFFKDNKCLYNYGTDYHEDYFVHMQKLHEDLNKVDLSKCGICHHMIFETKYIKELFNMVEIKHNELFYNVFLKNVTHAICAGASEYEIYFNYMLHKHPDEIIIRKLYWIDSGKLLLNSHYDYISYHHHKR